MINETSPRHSPEHVAADGIGGAGVGARAWAVAPDATFFASLPSHLRAIRLREAESAEYLGLVHGLPIAPGTLARKRTIPGAGPAFQRLGRTILYPRTSLDEWAAAQLGDLLTCTKDIAD